MKDSNILKITQIKISLPDKEIVLSSDEARKVYSELEKLFKLEEKQVNNIKRLLEEYKEIFEKSRPQKEYVPFPYPSPPIFIEKEPQWPNQPWIVTCESETTSNVNQFETLSINLKQTTNIK